MVRGKLCFVYKKTLDYLWQRSELMKSGFGTMKASVLLHFVRKDGEGNLFIIYDIPYASYKPKHMDGEE